jgi:hypothetical protein
VKREYQVDKAHTFTWSFYTRDIQDVPSYATVSIADNGGSVLSSGSGSIDSTGTISYIFSAVANSIEGRNFRLTLTYTVSGVETVRHYLFDVVLTPLVCDVTDEDLFQYVPELRNKIKDTDGTATSAGTTVTIYSDLLKNDGRSFKGGRISIFQSDTLRHDAKITDFSSGTVTFTPATTTAIASGTPYTIRPSFQTIIDTAFDQHIIRDVRSKMTAYTGTAAQYIDASAVHNLTIFKALEIYCFSQSEEDNDKWSRRANEFREQYKTSLSGLSEPYDKDEDGQISDAEDGDRPNMTTIKIVR